MDRRRHRWLALIALAASVLTSEPWAWAHSSVVRDAAGGDVEARHELFGTSLTGDGAIVLTQENE